MCHRVADCRLAQADRKSTRLNSSHLGISYAVFCLKKKNEEYKFKHHYQPYDEDYVEKADRFVEQETGRRDRLGDITAPFFFNPSEGNPHYHFFRPTRFSR